MKKLIPRSHENQINNLITTARLLEYKTTFNITGEEFLTFKKSIAHVLIEKDTEYYSFEIIYENRIQLYEIDLCTKSNTQTYTNLIEVIKEIIYEMKGPLYE